MTKKKNSQIRPTTSANAESSLGFPTGRVAQSIRKIISPSLTNHDVECITVVLVSHLMIEERINSLLVKWLAKPLPQMGRKNKHRISVNNIAKEELNKYFDKLDFVKKLSLIKPLGTLLWGDDSEDIFNDIFKINDARIKIAHHLDIKNIKIDNLSLATEKGLEHFLDLAQQRLLNISDLIELMGD